MNILENNIAQINRYNQVLAKKLENHIFNENSKFEFVNSNSQDVNLIYNGITVHDSNNPQQEALNTVKKINDFSENSITVILGLGLGYLFKRTYLESKGKIVVYEPDINILKFTLERVDFSLELADERVFIANSRTELIKFLGELYSYKTVLNFLSLASNNKLYPDELMSLTNDFPDIQNHLESNFTCLFKNSLMWATEGIKNIPEFINNYNIDALKNKFLSKPAIIVSAGPSLDKNIEALKKIRNKVIVFCVSTAYKALTKHGIEPDFVTFIDTIDCSKVVNDLDLSKTNLIIQAIASNNTFKIKSNKKFVFYSDNDLVSRWLSEKADFSVKEYENKGTVSYCALFSAYMAGCNPIILLGQDLAYTDGQCYSSSSAYGNMLKCVFDENTKKFKFEINDYDQVRFFLTNQYSNYCCDYYKEHPEAIDFPWHRFSISTVLGQNGEMMSTDSNYAGFIKYFEEFAYEKFDSNLELINSSIGGAEIKGYKNIELTKSLENYPELKIDINFLLDEILMNYNENIKVKSPEIKLALQELIGEIEKFNLKAIDARNKARQLLRELKQRKLNIDKIKKLSDILPQYYLDFKDNLLNKHKILLNCVFKEIMELTYIFENEQNSQGGIQDIIDIANISITFYDAYLFNAEQLKQIMQQVSESI